MVGLGVAQFGDERPERVGLDHGIGLLLGETRVPNEGGPAVVLGCRGDGLISLYCGQCGSRLTLPNAKSRRGVIYPFFMCTGRHAKRTNCERKSMFVPDIEAAVEDHYCHMQIPDHPLPALRELVTSGFVRLHQVAKHEAQGYKAERDAILGRPSSDAATPDQAVAVMAVLEAAVASAREGRAVEPALTAVERAAYPGVSPAPTAAERHHRSAAAR